MNQARRNILRGTVSTAVLSVAVAAGLLHPRVVLAAGRNAALTDALRALQGVNPVLSDAIRIRAPDIAEDGASVFIDFFCALPEVDALMVFVDRNPQPLVAAFHIAPEVVPALQMRIKVSQTAQVWVVARSAGQFYKAAKTVKVTAGGCGAGVN
ncbi:MAG: thiosulfate oxidation carrier protein SoxY [Gallionellaceae bacterium]|nr:thiosulfate oxidation carrier protein SoxY [Gallionellaceae bacterium]